MGIFAIALFYSINNFMYTQIGEGTNFQYNT